MPQEVTDATFQKEVLDADKPVIVDFWAPWCGPCVFLGPIFEKLSGEMTQLKFCKLNVDENQVTAAKFGVRSIPTMILFKQGKKVDMIIGALPEPVLKKKLEQMLSA